MMPFIMSYIGIGIVVLISMLIEHHFFNHEESIDIIMRQYQKSMSIRQIWQDRLIEYLLIPILVVLLAITCWPVAMYTKYKELKNERNEPEEFSVRKQDLVEKMTIIEIENKEMVEDPLAAVPSKPFGFLNQAWQNLITQLQQEDTIWSFKREWINDWGVLNIMKGMHYYEIIV